MVPRRRALTSQTGETPTSYATFTGNLSCRQSLGPILLISTKVRNTCTNRIQLLFPVEVLERPWEGRFG